MDVSQEFQLIILYFTIFWEFFHLVLGGSKLYNWVDIPLASYYGYLVIPAAYPMTGRNTYL